MKDFKAVIFDMDGVIFDTESVMKRFWQEEADRYKVALRSIQRDIEDIRNFLMDPLSVLFRSHKEGILSHCPRKLLLLVTKPV